MINVPTTSEEVPHPVSEFFIEYEKPDACFLWNEQLCGRIRLKLTGTQLDIVALKVQLFGSCKMKTKAKKEELSFDDVIHVKKEKSVVATPITTYDKDREFPFQISVPSGLPTSVDTKLARISYFVKATLTFKSAEGIDSNLHCVRGLTIIEDVDLNTLPHSFFEERHPTTQRKFGLFSCTGGHVKLILHVARTAFVSGESLTITDRRVEKVSVILQQRVRIGGDDENSDNVTVDVVDVHEDSLALFVDPGAVIKIDKAMHIPALTPSTPSEEHYNIARARRRLSVTAAVLKARPSQHSISTTAATAPTRTVKISYSLLFKVKSAGTDVMDVALPVVVGSIPLHSAVSGSTNEAIYKQCKNDKVYQITASTPLNVLPKTNLSFVNKYPFFADLKTSSKQSKKISVLTNTLRAETRFLQGIRQDSNERKMEENVSPASSGSSKGVASIRELTIDELSETHSQDRSSTPGVRTISLEDEEPLCPTTPTNEFHNIGAAQSSTDSESPHIVKHFRHSGN